MIGRAPGIDGCGASFFRAYWGIIKKEVIGPVKRFFSRSFMRTLLIFIPKSDNPVGVSDYRPISLCGFLYKICAKLLVG